MVLEPWMERLKQSGLVLASYRGPIAEDGTSLAAGGLASALREITHLVPTTWVAEGSRNMRVELGGTQVSPVRIPDAERTLFYGGFANRLYWMLAHGLYRGYPRREVRRWYADGYRPANSRFAAALDRALSGSFQNAVVWIHDYHLMLTPALLRERRPTACIGFFLHVPWPCLETWRKAPEAPLADLVRGLLGADLVSFQTVRDGQRFIATVSETVPEAHVVWAPVDRSVRPGEAASCVGEVRLGRRRVTVQADPISIDPDSVAKSARSPRAERWFRSLAAASDVRTVVRVDRLDPAKNITGGFEAFATYLRADPERVGHTRFLAFLVPTRESVPEYREYRRRVLEQVALLNAEFGRPSLPEPIHLFVQHNQEAALGGLGRADAVLINSLADGMNLVAKELTVAERLSPALVLSRTCGVAESFSEGALVVDPENIPETAQALARALTLPEADRRDRMRRLREQVTRWTVNDWAYAQLRALDGEAQPMSLPPHLMATEDLPSPEPDVRCVRTAAW